MKTLLYKCMQYYDISADNFLLLGDKQAGYIPQCILLTRGVTIMQNGMLHFTNLAYFIPVFSTKNDLQAIVLNVKFLCML